AAKLVIASASSTTARSPLRAARTRSQVASPTPTPGPIARAFKRRSDKNFASSAAPSTGRTITARLAAALIASASRGLAMVTSPAPARNAPRAASRAAPVDQAGPDTTTAWRRSYLWPSYFGTGKKRRHSAGTFANVLGAILSSTDAG